MSPSSIRIRIITVTSNSNESDKNHQGDANYVLDGTVLGFLPIYGNGSMWLEVAAITIIIIITIVIMIVITSLHCLRQNDWR